MDKKSNNLRYILAIETSFDDTCASLIDNGEVLTNVRVTGAGFNKETGGVVPSEAANNHAERIAGVIKEALKPLLDKNDRLKPIDILKKESVAIAVTYGPGLVGPLLVGIDAAKTLALASGCPLIPVNHLEGHIFAALTAKIEYRIQYQESGINNILDSEFTIPDSTPAICLIVSGGNTLLVLVRSIGDYEVVGKTRDDAAGEAFDKIARMMGLGFPGGPEISRMAQEFRIKNPVSGIDIPDSRFQIPDSIKLPRPMLYSKDLDFSFAGLKTAVSNLIANRSTHLRGGAMVGGDSSGVAGATLPRWRSRALSYETEEAITDVLVAKTIKATGQYGVKSVLLTGGVSANSRLREKMQIACDEVGLELYISPKSLCTDNAVMIGLVAWSRILNQESSIQNITKLPIIHDTNFILHDSVAKQRLDAQPNLEL